MKILVLSDSHSSLRFMFSCLEQIAPDAVIHLGDYFDDGAALREAFPGIRETATATGVLPGSRRFWWSAFWG